MAFVDVKPMSSKRAKDLTNLFKKTYGKKLNKTQKSQVKTIINRREETKYFDANTNVSQQYGSGAGVILADLTAPTQGSQNNQRDGNTIFPQRIELRARTECQTTNPSAIVRFIVFQFRADSTVAVPTLAGLLDNGPSGAPDVWSSQNINQKHVYNILMDKTYKMLGNIGADSNVVEWSKNLRKRMARVNFASNAVATGDHHIYMMIIGSNASGATGQLVTLHSRVYFKDS